MSALSAQQTDSTSKQEDLFFESPIIDVEGISDPSATTTTSQLAKDFPDFRGASGTYAQTHRNAARIITASVSDQEVSNLLAERQLLLDKKFDNTITLQESNRLEYVRWTLDRIEDARHGETLDRIEQHVNRYEDFLQKLEDFKVALKRKSMQRR
jgi:hypothetical protein